MTHQSQLITAAGDPARLRACFEAVRLGFHQARASDKQVDRFRIEAETDALQFRVVPDPDDPTGIPVGTLAGFDKLINAGREQLAARLITDVTVRPTHRRQGMLRHLMTEELTEAQGRGLPVAALTVTEATIYGRFGFGAATAGNQIEVDSAERFGLHPGAIDGHGRVRLIDQSEHVDTLNAIFAEFHRRTRGSIEWPHFYQYEISGSYDWEADGPDTKTRCGLHLDVDDRPDGFVLYRIGERNDRRRPVEVQLLVAANPLARLGLWDFLGSIDLTTVVTAGSVPVDDPLMWALTDRRGYKITGTRDRVWCRLLDPIRCLSARPWSADGEIVIEITDPMEFAAGRFHIAATDGAAEVTATNRPADVTMPVEVLSGLWLGGAGVHQIAAAGRIAGSTPAIHRLSRLMDLPTAPYDLTDF